MRIITAHLLGVLLILSSIMNAKTTLHHKGIQLDIESWSTSYDDNSRIQLSLASHHIKPIKITVTNASDKPIVIARDSLRVPCMNQSFLLTKATKINENFLSAYFFIVIATVYAATLEHIFMSDVRGRNAFPYVTLSWAALLGIATGVYHYFYKNVIASVALDCLILGSDTIIQPGDSVYKLAFLDSKAFNGLFTFRVFSIDKKSYATFFDVEFVR